MVRTLVDTQMGVRERPKAWKHLVWCFPSCQMPEKWLLLLGVCSERIHSKKMLPVSVGLGIFDPSPADYLPPRTGRLDIGLLLTKGNKGCLDGTPK